MRKYYTRACNFYYGTNAKKLIKKNIALALCGMEAMPPHAMQGMDADMMANMPPDAMGGMDADMMGAMPPDAMGGAYADMLEAIPPGALEGMDN